MEWKETAIIFTTLIHRFFFSYLQNQMNDREIDDFYLQITIFWIWKLMCLKNFKNYFSSTGNLLIFQKSLVFKPQKPDFLKTRFNLTAKKLVTWLFFRVTKSVILKSEIFIFPKILSIFNFLDLKILKLKKLII